ncbi:UNVERIFIED_CONTAM: hypothetical protein FKN15_021694 [Acipenser sinensis]
MLLCFQSHVLDNTYVISYSTEPMLEHTWQDGPEKTKYTVLHPITTPFMPRPPVVTNNTVPKARVFNVTLGTFLPDVELVKIIVGPESLTVPEANLKGYNVQEHVFPNGSKTYTLQVIFEDPNVKQKVIPPDTLPLTYLLNIVPENTPFTHHAVVEAILKDIIPPTVTGYCDGAAFYTMVTYGNMGRNWIPFIYFHCSVVICDSNRPSDSLCSRRCIPGKQRLGKSSVCWGRGEFYIHLSSLFYWTPPVGRSAEGMDGGAVKTFVSSGPIELKRD